jgi:hypothetical protein
MVDVLLVSDIVVFVVVDVDDDVDVGGFVGGEDEIIVSFIPSYFLL